MQRQYVCSVTALTAVEAGCPCWHGTSYIYMYNSPLDTGIYRQGPFLDCGLCHECRSFYTVLQGLAGFSNSSSWRRAAISYQNDCSIALLRHCVIALTTYISGTDAKNLGNGKRFLNEGAKLLSYWDKTSNLIFVWAMQRETYGCILQVFKSTFHF